MQVLTPLETDDPIDLPPLARVGGTPGTIKRASKLIRWLFIAALAVWLLLISYIAAAENLLGRVVGVTDGDTITVLDAHNTQHRIRLAGIDAPEKRQPFGSRSKENLSKVVFNKTVVVRWQKKDRYKRIVGVVLLDGRDVNLQQVGAGLAWWYRHYSREQTSDDRASYEKAEKTAQQTRLGLWSMPNAVPPWEWRRKSRRR